MEKRIIYPLPKGNVAYCISLSETETIEELAPKVVPKGVPYRIVDASVIPEDETYFDAWEADFSKPDGYGETGAPFIGENK